MKKLLVPALMALALSATGCMKVSMTTEAPVGAPPVEKKHVYFLWGLVGNHTVDVRSLCPSGVAQMQNRQEFVDGLVTGLTGGIVGLMTSEVTCASGQAWLLVPDAGGQTASAYPLSPEDASASAEAVSPALSVGGAL